MDPIIEQQGLNLISQINAAENDCLYWALGIILSVILIGIGMYKARTPDYRVNMISLLIGGVIIWTVGGLQIAEKIEIGKQLKTEEHIYVVEVLQPYLNTLEKVKYPVEYIGYAEPTADQNEEVVVIYFSEANIHVRAVWSVEPSIKSDVFETLEPGAQPYMEAVVSPESEVLKRYGIKGGFSDVELHVPKGFQIKEYVRPKKDGSDDFFLFPMIP